MRNDAASFDDPRSGAALISALGISLTIAGIAIFMIRLSSEALYSESEATRRYITETSLRSAFSQVAFELATDDTDRQLAVPFDVALENTTIEAVLRTPHANVDLNAASPFVLATLIAAVGIEENSAVEIADAIADWRDADDLVRANGAERDAYVRAGLEGPANRTFEAIEEIRHVLGVAPELADCLEAHLTVASGQTTPQLETASPWLRAAFDYQGEAAGRYVPVSPAVGEPYEMELNQHRPSGAVDRLSIIFRLSGDRANPVWIHRREFETMRSPPSACPSLDEIGAADG